MLRAQEGVAKVQAERLGAHAALMTALGGGLDDPANGPLANETLPGHGKGQGKDNGGNNRDASATSDTPARPAVSANLEVKQAAALADASHDAVELAPAADQAKSRPGMNAAATSPRAPSAAAPTAE